MRLREFLRFFWVPSIILVIAGWIAYDAYMAHGPYTKTGLTSPAIAELMWDGYGSDFTMVVKDMSGNFIQITIPQAIEMQKPGISRPTKVVATYEVNTYRRRDGTINSQWRTLKDWKMN